MPTKESHLGGFLANAVDVIHGEHVSDVISSTGVARGKWWLMGWNGKVPQGRRNPQDGKDLHPTESELGLTSMPTGNPWGFLSYNVRTGDHLHHEK